MVALVEDLVPGGAGWRGRKPHGEADGREEQGQFAHGASFGLRRSVRLPVDRSVRFSFEKCGVLRNITSQQRRRGRLLRLSGTPEDSDSPASN